MISLDGKKVVVIEDDRWYAEHIGTVLREAGVQYKIATHPQAAIECIDDVQPDALIVDVLLTGSTGFVLLHELQSHADLAKIPVILCTTLADSLDLEQLTPYGVRRILDKTTMYPDDILVALRGVLG